MFLPKSTSHRKAASCFINDNNDSNLIQLSPHKESSHLQHRSPLTLNSNQDSITNFIGDSILEPERPRAYVVTKTGEKHSLDLDTAAISKSSSNPFTIHSPRFSAPTLETISEKSSSQKSLPNKLNRSSCIVKKTKPLKRYINQKHRLVFTPRNVETTSSTQLLADDSDLNQHYLNQNQPRSVAKSRTNASTETQTEIVPSLSHSSYVPRQFNTTTGSLNYIPMEGPKKYLNDSLNTQRRFYPLSAAQSQFKPLKVYTTYNPNLQKYSELRNIASAITFVTVVFWLISKIFDIECFWDYLSDLWHYFCNWFIPKEKPKTKVEILATFLKDLLS